MSDDKRIQEIAERLEVASTHRGQPWLATCSEDWADNWLVASLGASNQGEGKCWFVTTDRVRASEVDGDAEDDAQFIANAPADIAFLLQRNAELFAALTLANDACSDAVQLLYEERAVTEVLIKERDELLAIITDLELVKS